VDFKSEARNPKFETIPNNPISNVQNENSLRNLNFEHSNLFRISIFEFRNYSTPKTCLVLAWPG